ncbi:hypothetical protein CsSME_00006083 [Camellia sinensis var. sinensis]
MALTHRYSNFLKSFFTVVSYIPSLRRSFFTDDSTFITAETSIPFTSHNCKHRLISSPPQIAHNLVSRHGDDALDGDCCQFALQSETDP